MAGLELAMHEIQSYFRGGHGEVQAYKWADYLAATGSKDGKPQRARLVTCKYCGEGGGSFSGSYVP